MMWDRARTRYVVHFWTGEGKSGYLCNNIKSSWRYTEYEFDVTCKNCLKKLKETNQNENK